jgi:hypothetical protein
VSIIMTSTTRRALVAGIATLPALAASTAALTTIPFTESDPIFAAIERHRAAAKAAAEASRRSHDAHERFRHENGRLTPHAFNKDLRAASAHVDTKFGGNQVRTHEHIDGLPDWFNGDGHIKASLHAELDRQNALFDEQVAPLEARSNDADHVEYEAIWDLAQTTPTTHFGLAALLRYVREVEQHHGESYCLFYRDATDGDLDAEFRWTIEKSICGLGNLPPPITPEPHA